MMAYTIAKEKSGICLTAVVLPMGRDVLVAVSGGDTPHIGCAALAVSRASLADATRQSATVSTLNIVGHKDDAVANHIARLISTALGINAAVVCGVHVEDITAQGVEFVIDAADALAEEIIQRQRSLL